MLLQGFEIVLQYTTLENLLKDVRKKTRQTRTIVILDKNSGN